MPIDPGVNWKLIVTFWAELDGGFKDRLPMLGVLHMEKVPRNGVDGVSKDDEENRDHVPMIGCAPLVWEHKD